MLKRIIIVAVVAAILVGGAVAWKINQRHYDIWLGDYFCNSPTFTVREEMTDIIFVVVDHWEPGGDVEIVNTWMQMYRELADRHIDADGVKLQHTFYYPIESFRGYEVDSIVQLSREGYGEVEVHLHHQEDNSISLRSKLVEGLDSLRAHGALLTKDSISRFSFIHGNWALDNSRSDLNLCGVDNEISILRELGCYADFTFPALGQTAQPSWVNKISYATDDPQQPKSYDTGERSRVGIKATEEQFMIFPGPMMINWSDWRFGTHPVLDDGNLYLDVPTSMERFELWLRANIHVENRPNWVFVRPFTHGAYLAGGAIGDILGARIDKMLFEAEEKYNDGYRYRLHYMTAREAYNVVKAAEAGLDGNPNNYRDYVLPPYVYPESVVAQEE